MTKINQQNVRSGMLKDDELKILLQQSEKLKNLPLWIDDSSIVITYGIKSKGSKSCKN
jgi:replicative DNA helicase